MMGWIKKHKYLLIGIFFDLMDYGLIEFVGLPVVNDIIGDVPPAIAMMFSGGKLPAKLIGLAEFIPVVDLLPMWTIAGYMADKGGTL